MNKPWLKTYDKGVPESIDADAHASVVALFEATCERYGDKPAFTCFGKTLSYADIDRRSRAVAAYLQVELGVRRGQRVALMTPNTFAFPIAMFGILRAGAAQVNVNPMYTARELGHQLDDAGVETIILYSGCTPVLAEVLESTPIKTVITLGLGDGSDAEIESPPVDAAIEGSIAFADVLERGESLSLAAVELNGDDTLFFQYTGGTTGLSKGAVLTHRNLVANAEQYKAHVPTAAVPGEEVLVLALPLYHIFGLMFMIAYVSIGARAILIPNPRDMDAYIAAIKDEGFSVTAGVNTLFEGMMSHPEIGSVDLSNYKLAVGGGAAVIPATSARWRELTGEHIRQGYGLSETSPVLSVVPISVSEFNGSCGLPLPSTEIRVLDDDGLEVATGEPGEICARGPQVMQGYWNNDEANTESFTDDGFFRTGDIGTLDEAGFLTISDRKKDVIIVSGFNVYPNEVESVAADIEGVAECACIGVPDDKTGEAVRLFVTRSEASEIDEATIIEQCRRQLARYKVPREVRFIDAIPKSAVGKLLRRELRDDP